MANQYLTGDVIADRMLARVMGELTFIPKVSRTYDKFFDGKGAKEGDSVKVRKIQHAKIRRGRVADLTPIKDEYINVKLDEQIGVDVGASSADLALNIDDFDEQYIKPFASDLAVTIEGAAIEKVTAMVPDTVGDYGLLDDRKTILDAGVRLDYNGASRANRIMLVNPTAGSQMVDAQATLFNSQSKVGKQYETGLMGTNTLGFDWYQSTQMASLTRGTGAGYLVNGANQSGSSLVVDTGTGTIKKGDTFTLAGVYAVHLQTKQSLGYLREFTVTENHAGGAGSIKITPALVTSGTEQNVTSAPADNAPITIEGVSGSTYMQNLGFVEDAFYFVTAALPLPKSMEAAGQRRHQGLNLRYIQGYDITNDMWVSRFDVIYGAGVLNETHAVRIPNIL